MKEKINNILVDLYRGAITLEQAQQQVLDLFAVSGSLPKNTTIWEKAREMEFAYFRKWWFSRVGNDR